MPLMPTSWRDRARLALWVALLLSWLILLPMLWTAFSTVPSAERLAQSRMVRIPTLQTVGLLVLQSAVEVGVLLALLFPWRPRFYLARLWIAAFAVVAWFIATTPLGLTRMSWIHRRWLAAVGVALLFWAAIATMARIVRGLRARNSGPLD
jgi:hypothetical protein